MSSRSLPVRLSAQAQRDFIDILRFTAETWGPNQLVAYRIKIDAALRSIGRNPQFGAKRDDLPATHRLAFVGAHVIVYRLEGEGVDVGIGVVRILHQHMSLVRHL